MSQVMCNFLHMLQSHPMTAFNLRTSIIYLCGAFANASSCRCAAAGGSPAREMLVGWAEDADGGKLGTLLQRYGAGPPSRALLTALGRQADAAAQDLASLVLAGAYMPR